MIDRGQLLRDIRPLVARLERDLADRAESAPHAAEVLREEYKKAREAGRTAQSFHDWCTDYATQDAGDKQKKTETEENDS